MNKEILSKLIKIVGSANAIINKIDMAKYLTEWRGVYKGRAGIILKPRTSKEVSKILKVAYETNTPVITQGGNTGLVGGQISFDSNHIVLSLTRLNKVRYINNLDRSITV
jgi:FAD/FMN-containing dehydrogenase